ncbi:mitochondrial coenzyme A diphosphatase NUDT8-like isoform X1 [Rhopilema esculentum]|uniref:mitochondrial coenzyme A diphosphatase NUDT8-like isoform X1 n=2 Tax=Rhopilema esculentum TaxID=499914 RepID=UPI0031D5CC19
MCHCLLIRISLRNSLIRTAIIRGLSTSSSVDHKIQCFFENGARDSLEKQCKMLLSDPTLQRIQRSARVTKKCAGALVPICIVEERPSLLFTVRSHHLPNHRGEISFPGGMKNDQDLSIEAAALREAEEELALDRNSIRILSSLGPFLNRKATINITAVFGYVGDIDVSKLKFSDNEVTEAFTVPIADLLLDGNNRYTIFRNGWKLPVFLAKQYHIWGITASITDTLLSMITHINYERKFTFLRNNIQNSFCEVKSS